MKFDGEKWSMIWRVKNELLVSLLRRQYLSDHDGRRRNVRTRIRQRLYECFPRRIRAKDNSTGAANYRPVSEAWLLTLRGNPKNLILVALMVPCAPCERDAFR